MADDDEAAAIGLQRGDEFIDAAQIQVVGRFVKHEKLMRGFSEEERREGDAETFAAGEIGHPAMDGIRPEEEASEIRAEVPLQRTGRCGAYRVEDASVLVQMVEPLRQVANAIRASRRPRCPVGDALRMDQSAEKARLSDAVAAGQRDPLRALHDESEAAAIMQFRQAPCGGDFGGG